MWGKLRVQGEPLPQYKPLFLCLKKKLSCRSREFHFPPLDAESQPLPSSSPNTPEYGIVSPDSGHQLLRLSNGNLLLTVAGLGVQTQESGAGSVAAHAEVMSKHLHAKPRAPIPQTKRGLWGGQRLRCSVLIISDLFCLIAVGFSFLRPKPAWTPCGSDHQHDPTCPFLPPPPSTQTLHIRNLKGKRPQGPLWRVPVPLAFWAPSC